MSDLQGHLIGALDAINHVSQYMELVRMAIEQLNVDGPTQLDRVHLLLDLYQECVDGACHAAKQEIEAALERPKPRGQSNGLVPAALISAQAGAVTHD